MFKMNVDKKSFVDTLNKIIVSNDKYSDEVFSYTLKLENMILEIQAYYNCLYKEQQLPDVLIRSTKRIVDNLDGFLYTDNIFETHFILDTRTNGYTDIQLDDIIFLIDTAK